MGIQKEEKGFSIAHTCGDKLDLSDNNSKNNGSKKDVLWDEMFERYKMKVSLESNAENRNASNSRRKEQKKKRKTTNNTFMSQKEKKTKIEKH